MSTGVPQPAVSVIMAVLNPHPAFFPQAVRSILDQTFELLELIIVEDPSPRDGRAMIADIHDFRIRHIVNPNRCGLIQQRNRALSEARADLVAILDADDVAEPDRLRKQVEYLTAHPDIGVLGSQITVVDERGEVLGYRSFPETPEDVLDALPRIVPLAQSSVTFRRSLVLDAGGYQNTVHPHVDDYELWSRLAIRGVRIANHPEALVKYRVHSEMGKATKLHEVIRGVLRVKRLYWLDRMGVKGRTRSLGFQNS